MNDTLTAMPETPAVPETGPGPCAAEDIAAFVGPHASGYLKLAARRRGGGRWPGFVLSAALPMLPWILYRRLWGEFGVLVLAMLAVGQLAGDRLSWLPTVLPAVLLPFLARSLVLRRARLAIAAAEAAGLAGEERRAMLGRAGGVSRAGALCGLAVIVAICAIPYLPRPDLPTAGPALAPAWLRVVSVAFSLGTLLAALLLLAGYSGRRLRDARHWDGLGLAGVAMLAVSMPESLGMALAGHLGDPLVAAVMPALVVGVAEEGAKLLATLALLRRYGGGGAGALWASLVVAVGFAGLENFGYLSFALAEGTIAGWGTQLLGRAVVSLPLHACCGVLIGVGLAGRKGAAIAGFAAAVGLHAVFDLPFLANILHGTILAPQAILLWAALMIVVPPLALMQAAALVRRTGYVPPPGRRWPWVAAGLGFMAVALWPDIGAEAGAFDAFGDAVPALLLSIAIGVPGAVFGLAMIALGLRCSLPLAPSR